MQTFADQYNQFQVAEKGISYASLMTIVERLGLFSS